MCDSIYTLATKGCLFAWEFLDPHTKVRGSWRACCASTCTSLGVNSGIVMLGEGASSMMKLSLNNRTLAMPEDKLEQGEW